MAARSVAPLSPRVSAPDLPGSLDQASSLRARSDLLGVALTELTGDVDAAHGRLVESRMLAAALGQLDLTGATLVDVLIDELRAVQLTARDATWRNVEVAGGRIATLDGLRAQWDSGVFRGVHIG